MARTLHHGRHTATIEGDFVVFLIGMRINKLWKIHRWWPVFKAMPPMIRELSRDPDSGLLGVTKGMLGGGPALLQYWRSFEDLERFARDPDAHHLPAWRAFNQRVRASGDVGIWHETYRVRAGEYEAIYANMPRSDSPAWPTTSRLSRRAPRLNASALALPPRCQSKADP